MYRDERECFRKEQTDPRHTFERKDYKSFKLQNDTGIFIKKEENDKDVPKDV
jgi:hypothetical protein